MHDARTLVGRLLRRFVDPWVDYMYFRLDLNDERGRPSHAKVMSTAAFLFGLVGLGAFGPLVLHLCEVEAPGCVAALGFFLAYAALVFAMAFGLQGYRIWAKSKTAQDTVSSFTDVAKATMDIAARRKAGGGTFEVTP